MILSAMGILTALVAIHEFGHYIVAKKRGIRVEKFAIGLGPKLIKWYRGETEFSFRPILIGGYVAFADDVEKEPADGDFRTAPLLSRVLTVVAGPVMNVLLAIAVAIVMVGVSPEFHSVRIATVEPGSPAAEAGLEPGDVLTEMNGVDMQFFAQSLQEYSGKPRNETMSVTAERGGQPFIAEVTFRADDEDRMLGITMEPAPHGFFETISLSVRWLWEQTALVFQALADLFFHGAGVENMTGIVGTTVVVGTVVQYGNIGLILMLIAVISVNLAIINLLPLPALDGGKLIMYGIEGISRKSVPMQVEGILNFAGMALIMGFAGLLVYQDILRLMG